MLVMVNDVDIESPWQHIYEIALCYLVLVKLSDITMTSHLLYVLSGGGEQLPPSFSSFSPSSL